MTQPKISVIVPAYNEEKYIARTLETLKNQIYKDYEIIVVNNNSTDKTGEIAKQSVKRVFLEKKKGYHNAVNRGVKESKADIITICDADSLYPPGWLERIMKDFGKDKDIVAVYGTCRFYDSNLLVNSLAWLAYTPFQIVSAFMGFHSTPGFNFAMKKWAYHKVGGYDPKIFNAILMDVQLGKRLQTIGKMKLDSGLSIDTSSRRFRKDGLLKTTLYFLDAWIRLNFGKKQKMSYEEYNKEYR